MLLRLEMTNRLRIQKLDLIRRWRLTPSLCLSFKYQLMNLMYCGTEKLANQSLQGSGPRRASCLTLIFSSAP
jgi:hypothetical protein